MISTVEPIYLLTRPSDKRACQIKVDARIEEIEKRPRKRVDIFLSQQRTRDDSFRIDVLNEGDPHYAIRFANLPTQLVHSFINLDKECNNFKMMETSNFLTAVFGCIYTRLFDLTSEETVDFIRHASHQVDPRRDIKLLNTVREWFSKLEKCFNVKIWLLDTCNEIVWKSNKVYIANKTLNILIVKKLDRWFSVLQRNEDRTNGVMTSKDFKQVLSKLDEALRPVDVALYR